MIDLRLGDCLEIMRDIPDKSVDAVITDPPYDEHTHKCARYGFIKTSSEIDFAPLANLDFLQECLRISKGWVNCFCAMEMFGDYKKNSPKNWVRAGFWRKPNGVPQFSGDRPGQPGEGIAIMHATHKQMRWNGHGRHAFWQHNFQQTDRVHQTQKPINLMCDLINDFTNPGDTILDPFMGSGTTGVACVKLNRNFIGIEISEQYFNIAKRRIVEAQRQLVMPLA